MEHLTDLVKKHKIIAIMRKVPADKAEPTVQALYEGGIRFVELTFDQQNPNTLAETASVLEQLVDLFGDKMSIGAGTVMNAEQVKAAVGAGAKYIISPNTDREVIEKTKELGVLSMPGALTPTEIANAYQWGADFVKLFPAGELGTGYIKAITAPLSHIPMLAVGGIDENNMASFLAAGVSGFGIGSNIVKNALINAGDYEGLTRLALNYTEKLKEAGY